MTIRGGKGQRRAELVRGEKIRRLAIGDAGEASCRIISVAPSFGLAAEVQGAFGDAAALITPQREKWGGRRSSLRLRAKRDARHK